MFKQNGSLNIVAVARYDVFLWQIHNKRFIKYLVMHQSKVKTIRKQMAAMNSIKL